MTRFTLLICATAFLVSCQATSLVQTTDTNIPKTSSPSSTPSSTAQKLLPTKTITPTPNPLSKYEGDCEFCWVNADGSNPLEPVWSNAAQGFTYHKDDPREKITIDQNFRVQAGETVTFENKIILIEPTQRKDIEVFGTLIIKDSLLIWKQTEYQQTRLRVKRGGTLIIENSYSFWGNQYWVNWEYEDGSTVKFNHFVGDPWTSLNGSVTYSAINYSTVKLTLLRDTHDSNVQILDSHHVWFEIFPPRGTSVFILPEKRKWTNWDVSDLWPNTTVEVKNSYIFERDVSLSNNTHVTIQDTPSGFSIGWIIFKDDPGFINCELKGLGEPGNSKGVYYENTTWDLPCNNSSLTVKNSLLQRAWPNTYGYVHLIISDSFLVDTRNYGAPATMEIYNSTIDIVAAYKGGKVYIENSPVKEAIEVKDSRSVIYGFGVSGEYQLLESDGGIYIELENAEPPW